MRGAGVGAGRPTAPEDFVDHGDDLAALHREPAMFADPARTVADRDRVRLVLAALTDTERAIAILTEQGYARAEIAELLELSERAVEGRLYRLRKKTIHERSKDHDDD